MKQFILLLLALLTVVSCSSESNSDNSTCYQLQNGLSVVLHQIRGAESTAIVVIYSIGEEHDPAGQSGMGHLIEHCYLTASAGKAKSRNFQQFIAAYPQGWNAQTGRRYTLFATVFPNNRFDAELKDASARMNQLNVKFSDMQREIPRIELELLNMYEMVPALSAPNLAAELIVPLSESARKGGIISQIRTIELEELKKRVNTFYKPQNAILVVAGDIDKRKVKQAISEKFSGIQPGRKTVPVALSCSYPENLRINKQIVPQFAQKESRVALAFRAPEPTDKLYPAFLVLVARMQKNIQQLNHPQRMYPLSFALLDRPECLTLALPVVKGTNSSQIVERLSKYVSTSISKKLSRTDIEDTKQLFGYMLGFVEASDKVQAKNVYGTAFSIGMRKQLKINSRQLLKELNAVSEKDLQQVAKIYFSPESYAIAVIEVK